MHGDRCGNFRGRRYVLTFLLKYAAQLMLLRHHRNGKLGQPQLQGLQRFNMGEQTN